MSTAEKVARNASVLFLANIVTLLLGFISLSITGRYLGAELFGVLSLAVAFAGMFGIVSDLGLSTLTTRELARNKSLVSKYVGNITVMRLLLAILTIGLIGVTAILLGYSHETISVIGIVAISIVFTSLTSMFSSVFQSFEKMTYQSIALTLNSALFLCGVVVAVMLGLDVISFAAIYFVVAAVVFIYCWGVFRRKCASSKLEIDPAFWRSTVQTALPFALTSVFVTVYYWIDSILLSVIKGVEVVGWYNAAYRLMIVLLVVPQVFSTAVLPAMSRFHVEAKGSLLLMRDTFFRYMVLFSLPMGIGVTFLANQIILFVFGAGYANSIIALQILVWSSVFIFLASPFARFLESSNKQLTITKVAIICMVENVVLNLVLIPPYGLVAASIVTVVTEGISFFLLLYVSGAVNKISVRRNLPAVGKTALAAGLMAVTVFSFGTFDHTLLTLAAICIYVVALYLSGMLTKTDIELLKHFFRLGRDQE